MPDDDLCPLNPSLRKVECAHCQGPPSGTSENPIFSMEEGFFNGFPVVEVLKNGGPVHPWDTHWCFGQRKAEILVTCLPVLREFWQAEDAERLAFATRIIENERHSLKIQVYVEMHPDFEHSTGQRIDRPWLHLRALPPDTGDIGLGAIKCRAVCAVEHDLRAWLRKLGIPE